MSMGKNVVGFPFHGKSCLLGALLLIAALQTEGCASHEEPAAPVTPGPETSGLGASQAQNDPWRLCNHASWIAFQTARTISWALRRLSKTRLDQPSAAAVSICMDAMKMGADILKAALEMGRPDPDYDGHSSTLYGDAENIISGCDAFNRNAPNKDVKAVIDNIYINLIPLIHKARDLCEV